MTEACLKRMRAAVYSNKNETCPECEGEGQAEVDAALLAGLGSSSRGYSNVSAVIDDRSSESDPYGLVTVTATADFQCGVPLGRIICGTDSTVTFTERKSLPHQGANYKP